MPRKQDPTDPNMALWLRSRRRQLRLTQKKVAEAVGVTQPMISYLERTGGIESSVARKLEKLYGRAPSHFWPNTDNNEDTQGHEASNSNLQNAPSRLDRAPASNPESNHEFVASDVNEPPEHLRQTLRVTRIIRDSQLARKLKSLHRDRCQLCGIALAFGPNHTYSEAHHIQPLSAPHFGPDTAENIIVLCPNHHAQCDAFAFELTVETIRNSPEHAISPLYIAYHNRHVRPNFIPENA